MTCPAGKSRREFLKRSIFVMGGLITLGLAVPSGLYVLSPLWKANEEDWVEIGVASQIPTGDPVKVNYVRRKKDGWVTVEERASVWVVTPDGQDFTVFDPSCTHLGCPYRWESNKHQFLCPCHNGIFSIDGAVLGGPPPEPLHRFPNKIVAGKLMVLPKVAVV